MFFGKKKEQDKPSHKEELLNRTDYPDGMIAKRFFATIDKVVKLQGPPVSKYIERLKKKNSSKSLTEQQAILDKHFMNIATGSGAGTGGVAAFPGIGTALSIAGIAGEAVLLLETCAVYALASAELNGVPTKTEEQRRAIVLMTVAGAGEQDVIAALSQDSAMSSVKSLGGLRKASTIELMKANSMLGRIAFRQIRKRFTGAMFRKVLPLGVGVVLGASANRKIAKEMIEHVHSYLDNIAE